MCTKEEVHEEVQQAVNEFKPSPLLKTIAGVWLVGFSAVVGWNGVTNFAQTQMLERMAYASEMHQEQIMAIAIMQDEIDEMETWQKVHTQFSTDSVKHIEKRIEDLHRIAEQLDTLINTKAADRWTGTDATQRIKHEDYIFSDILRRVQKLEDKEHE